MSIVGLCRSILEEDVRRTQERLEKIKASVKKNEDQGGRHNVRKRPAEDDESTDALEKSENKLEAKPKKQAVVALSHLGDEEEE